MIQNKSPAFQFYPNDWLSSPNIMLMTPAEEGAYIRLLSIEWNSLDCSLPDDDAILSQLSRLGEGWFGVSSEKIRKCFAKRDGKLFNERLMKERKKQSEWLKKSSEAGKKSWQVRKKTGQMTGKGWAKVGSEMVQTKTEPKPNSSSSISSSSSKKETTPYNPPKGDNGFEMFWKEYPKRIGKKAALNAWGKNSKPPIEQIIEALKKQKSSLDWIKEGGKYIPHPTTWLNQGRWDDEIHIDPNTEQILTVEEMIERRKNGR